MKVYTMSKIDDEANQDDLLRWRATGALQPDKVT